MEKKLLQTFGRAVRSAREQAGLSQEELAQAAKLHRTYVGGVERGERNLSLVNISRIARALHRTPAQLLEELR